MPAHHTLRLARAAFALATSAVAAAALSQGFKFSNEDPAAKAREQAQQARQQAIAERLSTPCRDQIKDKKIMIIIGEEVASGGVLANQENYGPHFLAINQRLRGLGLTTYTPAEIKKQIAQAEIDAYFKGNPDAALSASRRLGANFILRGLIATQSQMNPVIRVNEVLVNLDFTLTDNGGKMISNAAANGGTFSGSDVRSAAARMINEQADDVVSKLYSDYCSRATVAEPPRKADPVRKK